MRAVAYCRVSTNELDQLNSLNNQMNHYSELFKEKACQPVNVGMLYKKSGERQYLQGIFADEGITGTKKNNRKAFEYMMKCAENGEFDVIYVKNVQRFARNVRDGAGDLKRLKQLDIKVVFEDGNLNYHEHEAIINMFLSIAQEESRMKSVACKFGIRKAQQKGKWTSNTPYGYNRLSGYLEINDAEKEVVEQVYDLYVNAGWGHNKIVKHLRQKNIPTKKGGSWYQQHIKQILTSPLYKGIQTTHKTENMDVNMLKIADVPENEWIVHQMEELRIVDDATWQEAQDIGGKRSGQFKSHHRHSDAHLFSTVCACGNCGGVLRRKRKRTKVNQKMVYLDAYEWVCQNNDMHGKGKCSFRNVVDEEVLNRFVKEKIIGYREHTEILEERLKTYISMYYSLDTERQLVELHSKIKELKTDFNNQVRLNAKSIITDDELQEYAKEHREKLFELERQERKLKNIDKEVEEVKRQYKDFVDYLNKVNVECMTNADLKRIFDCIQVGTYDLWRDEKELLQGFDKALQESPYTWVNRDKGIFKHISAEHLFMNIKEGEFYKELS